MPHADGSGVLPEALPGEVPDPAHPPAGCRFHPRCPYAFDRCSAEDPVTLEIEGDEDALPAGCKPAAVRPRDLPNGPSRFHFCM